MHDALEKHLQTCHSNMLNLSAVMGALMLLIERKLGNEPITSELAAAAAGMAIDLENSLDVVNLPKGPIHAAS